jgi:hypothetical protein
MRKVGDHPNLTIHLKCRKPRQGSQPEWAPSYCRWRVAKHEIVRTE